MSYLRCLGLACHVAVQCRVCVCDTRLTTLGRCHRSTIDLVSLPLATVAEPSDTLSASLGSSGSKSPRKAAATGVAGVGVASNGGADGGSGSGTGALRRGARLQRRLGRGAGGSAADGTVAARPRPPAITTSRMGHLSQCNVLVAAHLNAVPRFIDRAAVASIKSLQVVFMAGASASRARAPAAATRPRSAPPVSSPGSAGSPGGFVAHPHTPGRGVGRGERHQSRRGGRSREYEARRAAGDDGDDSDGDGQYLFGFAGSNAESNASRRAPARSRVRGSVASARAEASAQGGKAAAKGSVHSARSQSRDRKARDGTNRPAPRTPVRTTRDVVQATAAAPTWSPRPGAVRPSSNPDAGELGGPAAAAAETTVQLNLPAARGNGVLAAAEARRRGSAGSTGSSGDGGDGRGHSALSVLNLLEAAQRGGASGDESRAKTPLDSLLEEVGATGSSARGNGRAAKAAPAPFIAPATSAAAPAAAPAPATPAHPSSPSGGRSPIRTSTVHDDTAPVPSPAKEVKRRGKARRRKKTPGRFRESMARARAASGGSAGSGGSGGGVRAGKFGTARQHATQRSAGARSRAPGVFVPPVGTAAEGDVVLQFGRLRDGRFFLDTSAPLSLVQAFSMVLCQFWQG